MIIGVHNQMVKLCASVQIVLNLAGTLLVALSIYSVHLDFDFARFIGFFSSKLAKLNMVLTQRNYGNILRLRKTDAFV